MSADQIAAEIQSDADAMVEAAKAHAALIAKGDIDKLPRGKAVIARMFDDVRDSIVAEQQKKHRGVGAALRGWLRELDADVAAVIALRVTMGCVLQHYGAQRNSVPTFQRIATSIGREWALELKVRAAARINPVYYDGAIQRLKDSNTTSQKHTRLAMSRVIENSLDGVYDSDLTPTEYMHLGKVGLQACMDAGLVDVQRSTSAKGHLVEYALTDPIRDFLLDEKASEWLAQPVSLTMVSPPLRWDRIVGGGFHTEKRQLKFPLLRTHKRIRHKHLRAYRNAMSAETMPNFFEPINYLQSIPYAMSDDMYETVHGVWADGGGVLKIPPRTPPVRPEFPHSTEWSKDKATETELEEFQRWKRQTFNWHNAIREHKAVSWEMHGFSKVVGMARGTPVWNAMFADTRGRLYYRGACTPQGTDATKAVVQFARKKALGRRGVYWLKVHIANCFGFDKKRFKERAAWTDEHWEHLAHGAVDPANSDLYRANTDAPLMAVAAVRELAAAYASGNPETFESGSIVHMDATCSGLQHLSAMLRDSVGGRYVNLVPGGDEKADIYARVAQLAMMQIERDAEGGHACGVLWKELGVSRKLAKGPVMTYVYGATLRSVADGIGDFLDEQGYSSKETGVAYMKMCMYLAKLLFKAIEDTVPAAAALMRWLKDVVRHHDRTAPVVFTTPHGLHVHHDYPDEEQTRVRVRSCGVEYVVMHNQLDTSKATRMQNAIAPNFVHAMDGCHLSMTAQRMAELDLDMAVIHDSFGTHPCDVDAMHECIRAAFIELYTDNDVLLNFAIDTGTWVLRPLMGDLDLSSLMDSEFFFC
jgi:DNA-directed RNA polymerase